MAFASLEMGRDEKDLQGGGLSLKKNPLLVSIVDGCETLKGLAQKNQLTAELVSGAKAMILMRTDKVRSARERGAPLLHGAASRRPPVPPSPQQRVLPPPPPHHTHRSALASQ